MCGPRADRVSSGESPSQRALIHVKLFVEALQLPTPPTMTAQMTSSARTERHPDFDHVAVYHEGDDDLAEQLLPDIAHALGKGDAVLVCSPRGVWDRISARLGQASAHIEYVPDAVRYAHPNVAMRILNDFVRDRTRNGARAA